MLSTHVHVIKLANMHFRPWTKIIFYVYCLPKPIPRLSGTLAFMDTAVSELLQRLVTGARTWVVSSPDPHPLTRRKGLVN